MLKKAGLLTRPTLATTSPARPEAAKTTSSPRMRLVPSKAAVSDLRWSFQARLLLPLGMAPVLVPLRPSSEHILIVRAPGARDQHGRHSTPFIVRVLRAKRAPGCSPLIPLRPCVARAQGDSPGRPLLLAALSASYQACLTGLIRLPRLRASHARPCSQNASPTPSHARA